MGRLKFTDQQITFRVASTVVERADDLMEYVATRSGHTTTRTEVLREALARGLTLLERERDKEKAR